MTKKNTLSHVVSLERAMAQQKLAARIPGSFTNEEYAAETERSPVTTRPVLVRMVASGQLKKVKVPKLTSEGRVQMVDGYVVAKA